MVAPAQLADHGGGLVDGAGDEVGVLAVGRVPVAAVEYADRVVIDGGEGLEEADEAMFVVDLSMCQSVCLVARKWRLERSR